MNKVFPFLALSVLLLVPVGAQNAFAGFATGELITFEFEMEVTSIDDASGTLTGVLGVGDTVSGDYSFFSDAIDESLDPEFGIYETNSFNLNFDSFSFAGTGTGDFCDPFEAVIGVFDTASFDEYILQNCTLEQTSGTPLPPDQIFVFILDDFDGTVFSDSSLPLTPPDLSEFENNFAFLVFDDFGEGFSLSTNGMINFDAIQPQDHTVEIEGFLTSLTVAKQVGGEGLPVDSTALIVAGAQSYSWMIPLMISALGIGLFLVSKRPENS